jgi:hypothetical protein
MVLVIIPATVLLMGHQLNTRFTMIHFCLTSRIPGVTGSSLKASLLTSLVSLCTVLLVLRLLVLLPLTYSLLGSTFLILTLSWHD